MNLAQIRELAAWHEKAAKRATASAEEWEKTPARFRGHYTEQAAACRRDAQFHASSSIHLTEMADGLEQGLRILASLNIK